MIDWSLVVLLIRKNGYTTKQVAVKVDVGVSHIYQLATGVTKEPRFIVGVKLLDMLHDVATEDELKRVLKREIAA